MHVKNDKSTSAALSSMNSNAEKSTMMEMTSAPNLA